MLGLKLRKTVYVGNILVINNECITVNGGHVLNSLQCEKAYGEVEIKLHSLIRCR